MLTDGPQLDRSPERRPPLSDQAHRRVRVGDRLPDAADFRGGTNARLVVKEPVGVVGAITPWNFPFEVTLAKLGQALATGNTVVLKPAPDTPWNATLIGRLVAERTDFPAGVLNVVTSSDHLVGEELTLSPQVDLISFTGSTAVGKRIMEKGAATMKRLFLELGGKSATIVLDDADFDSALMVGWPCARTPARDAPSRPGCCSPAPATRKAWNDSRSYLAMVPYGDPQRDGRDDGPLISEKQRDRVLGLHRDGRPGRRHPGLGGGRPKDLPKGFFVEPTMFTDVDNSMTIAQEEIFGPVLVVIPFDDDDDAVRIANQSSYGLSGAVSSASMERSMSVARRVRTGTMGVNGGMWYGADVPFGGYKDSGVGRQNGIAGFDQYLEVKSIAWPSA